MATNPRNYGVLPLVVPAALAQQAKTSVRVANVSLQVFEQAVVGNVNTRGALGWGESKMCNNPMNHPSLGSCAWRKVIDLGLESQATQ